MTISPTRIFFLTYLVIISMKVVTPRHEINRFLETLKDCTTRHVLFTLRQSDCVDRPGPGCAQYYLLDTYHITNITVLPPELKLKTSLKSYSEQFACNSKGCAGPGGVLQFEWEADLIKICSIYVEATHLDPGESMSETYRIVPTAPRVTAGVKTTNSDMTFITWMAPMCLMVLVAMILAQVSNNFVKEIRKKKLSTGSVLKHNPIDLHEVFSKKLHHQKKHRNTQDFLNPNTFFETMDDEKLDKIVGSKEHKEDKDEVFDFPIIDSSESVRKKKKDKKHKNKRGHKHKSKKHKHESKKKGPKAIMHIRRKSMTKKK